MAGRTGRVLIVGAGLAGLVCAKELQAAGVPVLLLEAGAKPGGKMQSTRRADGYVLDHGFQVVLDSYPAIPTHLDVPALEPRYFTPGAYLANGMERDWELFTNAFRQPWRVPGMLAPKRAFTQRDKVRLAALASSLLLMPDSAILSPRSSAAELNTEKYLSQYGFTDASLDAFFRPFFGGVFLDDALKVNATLFRYYLKKFLTGRTFISARGIQAIPQQLADQLQPGTLHLQKNVTKLRREGGKVVGVDVESGESLDVDSVVLATDVNASRRLLEPDHGLHVRRFMGVACLYYASNQPLYGGKLLVLPPGRARTIRHLCQVTNVAPELAPRGKHLLSVTVLESGQYRDEWLVDRVRVELADFFGSQAARGLEYLQTIEVPHALPRQGDQYWSRLAPTRSTKVEGLYFAGEQTTMASIQGAMESGENTARAVLEDLQKKSYYKQCLPEGLAGE